MQAPKRRGVPMADSESVYQVGPGRPPLHTRFKKGESGSPGGRSAKSLPALLADALNETVVVTIDGRRRTITKREAIVTQMVDKSASADLRATKSVISSISRRSWLGRASRPAPTPNISITIASFARLKIFMGFHHSPQAMQGCPGKIGR